MPKKDKLVPIIIRNVPESVRRVIKNALSKIDDAISLAILLRDMRKKEIKSAIV